jgi:general secretion pathway protein C
MLSLEGVYKDTTEPKNSIAIISKGGLSKVVKVGDKIFGFRLKEVQDKSVILEQANQDYTLNLPKARVVSSSYSIIKNQTPAQSSSKSKESLIKDEDGQKIVPRDVINSYKKDMKKIWQNIAISDYKEGGVLKGFKVRYIKKGSIFEKLGLQRGDIITGINGEMVKSYSLPMRVFSNIDSLEGLILQVKRGNNEVELEYEIR